MKRALIVSQNFNPGHVSHLVAGYKQFQELGFQPSLFLDRAFKDFIPQGIEAIFTDEKNRLPMVEVAFILFPSLKNPGLIRSLRRQGTTVLYLFHEPLKSIGEFKKAGFSFKYLLKLRVIDAVNAYTVNKSNIVLLPSRKAEANYKSNPKYKNKHSAYLPLMFDDESDGNVAGNDRPYFSYIGTVAADHSFEEFLQFVTKALKDERMKNFKFLIATKSEFAVPTELDNNPRVKIQKGKPLTNEQINLAYASSLAVWNAYARTTQSGVLAKAYMFGTPAVVMNRNLNEYMKPGETVEIINDNSDYEDIRSAVEKIAANPRNYQNNCRNFFLENFHYRNYNEQMEGLLATVGK